MTSNVRLKWIIYIHLEFKSYLLETTATIEFRIEINVKCWIHSVARGILKSVLCEMLDSMPLLLLSISPHMYMCVYIHLCASQSRKSFIKVINTLFLSVLCWCCKLRWWHFTYPTTAFYKQYPTVNWNEQSERGWERWKSFHDLNRLFINAPSFLWIVSQILPKHDIARRAIFDVFQIQVQLVSLVTAT